MALPTSHQHYTHLFSAPFIIGSLVIAFLYGLLSLYLVNYRLVIEELGTNAPLWNKLQLLGSLIQGLTTAYTSIDVVLLLLTSLLVGVNVMLIITVVRNLKNTGGITLSVGGGSVAGLVSTGCGACGLTFLSVIGLTSATAVLPFHGKELQLGGVTLLIFSLIYMGRKLTLSRICKTK